MKSRDELAEELRSRLQKFSGQTICLAVKDQIFLETEAFMQENKLELTPENRKLIDHLLNSLEKMR